MVVYIVLLKGTLKIIKNWSTDKEYYQILTFFPPVNVLLSPTFLNITFALAFGLFANSFTVTTTVLSPSKCAPTILSGWVSWWCGVYFLPSIIIFFLTRIPMTALMFHFLHFIKIISLYQVLYLFYYSELFYINT